MARWNYNGNVEYLMDVLRNCWFNNNTECCKQSDWDYCKHCEYNKYYDILCISQLLSDIEDCMIDQSNRISALERQVNSIRHAFFARLLTLEELMEFTNNGKNYLCYIEDKNEVCGKYVKLGQAQIGNNNTVFSGFVEDGKLDCGFHRYSGYNIFYRCWTFEPTEYQVKNTQWEAELCE